MVDCTILLQYLPTVRSVFTADEDVNVSDILGKHDEERPGLSKRVWRRLEFSIIFISGSSSTISMFVVRSGHSAQSGTPR